MSERDSILSFKVKDSIKTAKNVFFLTKWRAGWKNYLARGHGVRPERNEVRAP